MHEYSLMRGLLSQVDELRTRHQADRVVSIRLIVGEFSGVEADLLQSAFDDLSRETPMAGAALDIQRTSLSGRCADCESVFTIEKFRFICPHCESAAVSIDQGEELLLETVTLANREREAQQP